MSIGNEHACLNGNSPVRELDVDILNHPLGQSTGKNCTPDGQSAGGTYDTVGMRHCLRRGGRPLSLNTGLGLLRIAACAFRVIMVTNRHTFTMDLLF